MTTAADEVSEPRWITHLRRQVDVLPPRQTFLAVLVVLLAVYVPTATYDYRINVDAAMAAMPAWNLVENGTLELSMHEEFLRERAMRTVHLVQMEDGSYYSNRTIGVIAWGIPFYALFSPWIGSEVPFPMYPAAVAGFVATALGIAVLHLVFRRLVTPWSATVAALVAGLGTGAWAVAADGLWPHGPGILWGSLALYAMVAERFVLAGGAFGAGLLIRPYMAVGAALTGLVLGWSRRSVRPCLQIGLASGVGLAALVTFNRTVFGGLSLTGGYGEMVYVQNVGNVAERDYLALGQRLAGAFVDPARGMLWYSPFLIVLALGVLAAWRRAEPWVRGAAVAGVGVLLTQYWVQPTQGGSFFFGPRYSIEPLVLWAPLLVLAWREWVVPRASRERAFRVAVVLALSLQVLGAALEPYKWA